MFNVNFYKQKRIPSWIAVLILVFGGAAALIFLQQPNLLSTYLRATPEITPDQIQITNITNRSFTVSWITAKPTEGLVKYGAGQQTDFVARDQRDPLTGELNAYFTHLVTVTGLEPATAYAFKIQSAGHLFDSNKGPYMVTTAQSELEVSSPELLHGVIVDPDNQPAAGAIVYLKADNLSPRSTLVTPTGEWRIDMSQARVKNFSQAFSFTENQSLFELFVQDGNLFHNSTVSFSATRAGQVPKIVLGQDYDFSSLAIDKISQPADLGAISRFSFAPLAQAQQAGGSEGVIIWNPQPEEAVATNQPLVIGSSPPGTNLQIELQGPVQFSDQSLADDRGYWQWNPTVALPAGDYAIIAKYISSENRLFSSRRDFTILTSIGGPAIEASPSARLSPTPSIRLEISLTPSSAPVLPSLTPTLKPTNIPSPTQSALQSPTPTPAVPIAGFALPTMILTGLGLVLMGLGVLLVL
jgi:hypothetical protein